MYMAEDYMYILLYILKFSLGCKFFHFIGNKIWIVDEIMMKNMN